MKELHSKMAENVTMGLLSMFKFLASSLQGLNVIPSSTLTSILVKKVRVKQGTLHYHRNDEKKRVDVSKDYENYFNVTVLEKVNAERCGQETYPVEEEFYPTLYRLLIGKSNWGLNFQFRGRLTFMIGELPLTRNFHHSAREVGISLHDLEQIGDLPNLGATYQEFYLETETWLIIINILLQLLSYYFHKVKHIYYDLWLDHFYREYLIYFAYGEQTNSKKEKFTAKKRSLVHISHQEECQT
ncbi:LOW QUALITY PROTEIN: hypothetical protein Cgig2_017079 [Carnegiea gigantea]|uniref:Uncharacterized protein n=1 Tax=Carnegiea gigantea TaxID=171969 RepID=A0A9Q1JT91_9CARY|nr:LOW QUALITY PROTEIN: hypothetical protein Cgig2_017079 [Carnegiea gigantea]